MERIEELLARNERIAGGEEAELPPLPAQRLVVLTCMDHRVDPAHVFGLALGEGAVIRNPGGRVTPAFLQQLAILARVFPQVHERDDPFELLLVQHTECGFGRLDDDEHAELLASYFEVPVEEVPARHLRDDPHAAVRADLELLAGSPAAPDALHASGLVYELASGRAELVERRVPLRPA